MSTERAPRKIDRELSWLAFNERVLQEAEDPRVPVGERLAFLAIYSSNLDEFFRVRVASLRSLLRLGKKSAKELGFKPAELLQEIHRVVDAQQTRFGEIFRDRILPALGRHGIRLLDEHGLDSHQVAHLRAEFEKTIRPHLAPIVLDGDGRAPFLANRRVYLVAELWPRGGPPVVPEEPHWAIVEVPAGLPRFLSVPAEQGRAVIFLDDVIRLNLPFLFPEHTVGAAYAVKLTRDAELQLEDEFSGDLVDAIRKSLTKREQGPPSRFLYDPRAPYPLIRALKERFELEEEDLIPGGRYHNLHDLASFPRFGIEELSYPPMPPLPHPVLDTAPSIFQAIEAGDQLLHLPYQSFDPVIRFLREAAADPQVTEIWITLYRVARESAVVDALIEAARRGKRVTAFIEVKARFDEESNLGYGERLETAGVRTLYSMPGLKVHAKLALVVRGREPAHQAYLSTGNFNERTSRVYADHGLFTADRRITEDVRRVFAYLAGEQARPRFEHLLVAPFALRKRLNRLIRAEADAAREGRAAGILLKLNSLEDDKIIERLYEAADAGVPITLIVRGICRIVPGRPGLSESIRACSIVDRFLEHARIFAFHAAGEDRIYLASADWMNRNLSRRVEVAFPIYDPRARRELRSLLHLQLADNTSARSLDEANFHQRARGGAPAIRAQQDFYRLLQGEHEHETVPFALQTSPEKESYGQR